VGSAVLEWKKGRGKYDYGRKGYLCIGSGGENIEGEE